MYLVLDTETTGLPHSWSAPASDVSNWPRIIQIAWEAFDSKDRKTESQSYVIRPDGFVIPADAQKVHGISTSIAKSRGIPIAEALDAFLQALPASTILIGHNISFDLKVVGAELHRLDMGDPIRGKIHLCTMETTTEFCAIPGRYGHKWPTLAELHEKLFKTQVKETHDAAADVATCAKCFFELKRLGVVHGIKARNS